jgi:hypothetical protein
MMPLKDVCPGCGQMKYLSVVRPHRCKECNGYKGPTRNYTGSRERNNLQQRNRRVRGVWLERLEDQEGLCAICGRVLVRMCRDHDHESGKNRGILCYRCNMGLGYFKDNPELLQVAVDYLRKWAAVL